MNTELEPDITCVYCHSLEMWREKKSRRSLGYLIKGWCSAIANEKFDLLFGRSLPKSVQGGSLIPNRNGVYPFMR